MPGVGDRLGRDAAGHLPDFRGVVLDPARPREVLLELRVGAAGDPPAASKTRQVVPVVPWSIARITTPHRERSSAWGTHREPRGARLPGVSAVAAPTTAGLVEQARLPSRRDLHARAGEAALERARVAQQTLNAFRVICAEEALAAAEEADRRLAAGDGAPLLGVPVAIKDDVDLAGHTTPFGCGGGRPAVRDAEAVRRLREAGAIVIGKTHAPEVGQWHFTETPPDGATRNPWNTDHTPGGSSGGAAAAVAAGVVPAAIGSDGAGSIRIPAAWTGLVGLKPQRGRVSTWPDPEAFNGLSCYGPLARSAADAALLLDAVHGNVPADLHQPAAAARALRRGRRARARPPAHRALLRHALRRPRQGRPRAPGGDRGLRRAARRARPRDRPQPTPTTAWSARRSSPRGEAAVEEWLCAHGEDRSALEPRTRVARPHRQGAAGRAAAPRPRRRARPAAPHRPRLRALRRRPHPDHGEAARPASAPSRAAATGRPATPPAPPAPSPSPGTWSAGPAISVPAGLTPRPADRRPAARPRKRRGDAALARRAGRAGRRRLATGARGAIPVGVSLNFFGRAVAGAGGSPKKCKTLHPYRDRPCARAASR